MPSLSFSYVCLDHQIVVKGEVVRESRSAWLDTDTQVLSFVTSNGKLLNIPWSRVDFALPIIKAVPIPEELTAPTPQAKVAKSEQTPEPRGPGRPRKG